MILIQCIENVYGEAISAEDCPEARLLFKARHFYMGDQDSEGHLVTQDEDGEPHIIADDCQRLKTDTWFNDHFTLA
ncbi:MAG: hypothetical protein ABF868_11980 [Sporolactobacillus sp.]